MSLNIIEYAILDRDIVTTVYDYSSLVGVLEDVFGNECSFYGTTDVEVEGVYICNVLKKQEIKSSERNAGPIAGDTSYNQG